MNKKRTGVKASGAKGAGVKATGVKARAASPGLRLKTGVNLWALPGRLSWEEALDEAAAAGFDGIEPNLENEGWISVQSTRRELADRAAAARRAGLDLVSLSTGLLWETSLTAADHGEAQRARRLVRCLIEAAAGLGVDTVLVVPGAVDVFFLPGRARVRYDHAMDRLVSALEELVPAAEREGVTLALETVWNRFLLSPLEMRALVDRFASPGLAVYLDVGNVLLTGYPQDWIDILADRVARVHVKGFRRSGGFGGADGFCGLLSGEVDWPEVVAALARVGYRGYLTAELFRPSRMPAPLFLEETARELRWIVSLGGGLGGARGAAGPRAGRRKSK